jgi:hypothetical protein
MRYAGGLSVHLVRPALVVAFDDDTSAEAAYLLTVAREDASPGRPADARPLHGVNLQVDRQIGPYVRAKLGYAHGAEVDLSPASYTLLELVSDAAWVGAAVRASPRVSFFPLYRVMVYHRDAAPTIVAHALELGQSIRW